MRTTSIVFGLLLCLVCTGNARAEETRWSMIAGACVPNYDTARKGLIRRNAGGASFAPNRTGEAVLFCPVENAHQTIKKVSWIKLTMNRTLAGGVANASLFRMEERTGRLSQVGQGARATADHEGLGTFTGPVGDPGRGHTFEEGFFYYVRIVISKNGLLNRISVKRVSLGID